MLTSLFILIAIRIHCALCTPRQHCSTFVFVCAVYMPHLSLIYGDLSDEEKEAVMAEFGAQKWSQLANHSMSFHVSSLALYRTNPRDLTMASWERLGVYPLEG